jgi:hypothetical protein
VVTICNVVVGCQRFGDPCGHSLQGEAGWMGLRNVGILPQHYMSSRPEDGALRNVGILKQHYMSSQPDDGGIMALRNFGILPQHYISSRPEDGGSIAPRNVCTLTQQYTSSQPRRPRLEFRHLLSRSVLCLLIGVT